METTQILYLVGAFILGFIFAWFAGRSGPKRALEESEASAHSLQRTVDDRTRAISKLGGQLKEQQAKAEKLGIDNGNLTAMLKNSETGLSDAGAEIARLQTQIDSQHSDRLLLESELGHTRDAYSSTRTRVADLAAKLEEAEAVAAAAAAATMLAAPPPDYSAEVQGLTAQVESLRREVDLARAATARMSVQAALRPQLTPAKREEYAALAGNPERVVAALHERDVVVADSRTEAEYLRRNLSTLTAAGAELATSLERRNREHQLLLNRLSDLTATDSGEFDTYAASAATRALPMMAPVGFIQSAEEETTAEVADRALAAEIQDRLDERLAELDELTVQSKKLQANLDELQAEIDSLSATKADLEAQLALRDTALVDATSQQAALQAELDATAAAKAALQDQVLGYGVEVDDLVSRLATLSGDLEPIAAEDVVEVAPVDVAETTVESAAMTAEGAPPPAAAPAPAAAPGVETAPDVETAPVMEAPVEPVVVESPVKQGMAKLAAGVAAAVAVFKRKKEKIAGFEQQVELLSTEKGSLESGLAEKDQVLADTQGKLEQFQNEVRDRSVKFDALSLRSSSLEADMEISGLNQARFDDQVRQIAIDLHDLAVTYGDGSDESTAESVSAPVATGPADATPTPDGAAPAAEVATAAVVDASVSAVPATEVAVTPVVEAPVAVPPKQSTLNLLAASAAALSTVVRSKADAFAAAQAQLAAVQAQAAELAASKSGIASELAAKSENLADFEAQLQAMQADLGSRTADLDGTTLKLAALQSDLDTTQATRAELEGTLQQVNDQLATYLAEYGEVVAVTDAVPAAVDAVAPDAPMDAVDAAQAPTDAVAATPVAVAPVAAIVAGAAAVGELLKRHKDAVESADARIGELEDEIGALTSQRDDLETNLQSKDVEIADATAQIHALQSDVATRASELDSLGQQIAALQTELDEVKAAKVLLEADLAQRDEEIQALDQRTTALEAQLTEAESARLALETDLDNLNHDLVELGMAFDAGDEDSQQSVAQRLVGVALAPDSEAATDAGAASADAAEAGAGDGVQEAALVVKVTGVAAVAGAIQKKQMALKDANAQLAAMQEQLDALSASKADLETQLDQTVAAKETTEAQVTDLQSAKVDLETELAKRDEEIQMLDQKMADLQAKLNEAESARLALEADLENLNNDLTELGAAFDAGNEDSQQSVAQRLGSVTLAPDREAATDAGAGDGDGAQEAPPVVKVAGVAAVAGAIQKKQMALKDANAQLAAMQEQLDTLSTSKADLETQFTQSVVAKETTEAQATDLQSAKVDLETELQSRTSELDALKAEFAALKEQLDTTMADRDAVQVQLQAHDSELNEAQTRLTAITTPPPPKTVSDFKAAARAAAVSLGVEPQTTSTLQDLTEVKHIGSAYEQRLYRAGAGTFWEVAHLTDDDLQLILKLTEMQKLALNFDEARADARRLAEGSDGVGLLWEGQIPDDFEPIQGIGKVFEQRLYDAGIRTYQDLVNTSEERLAAIVQARKPLEPDFASWIRQAKTFLDIRNG